MAFSMGPGDFRFVTNHEEHEAYEGRTPVFLPFIPFVVYAIGS